LHAFDRRGSILGVPLASSLWKACCRNQITSLPFSPFSHSSIEYRHSKSSIPTHQKTQRGSRFVPEGKVKAYLEANDQEKLKEIIAALFPQGDGIYPNDVLPDNIAVFCTLLQISKGRWMKYFRHHRSLRDAALPFDPRSKPPDWPKDTGDPDFLKKFCEEQWKFCVPVMRQPFGDEHFPKDLILPIVYKKLLDSGGSAILWQIKLHPAYNNLITEEEKAVRLLSCFT
jgi:hypothetical protein